LRRDPDIAIVENSITLPPDSQRLQAGAADPFPLNPECGLILARGGERCDHFAQEKVEIRQEAAPAPRVSHALELQLEPLPPLPMLERDWHDLEAVAGPSFFTSWFWIGTLLEAVPAARRPSLLRGSVRGETVVLALLGRRTLRRRHGLVHSRSLFLNETGDPFLTR
jgi:hypothetical protein